MRTLPRSALLLLLIASGHLAAATENDDLVFDQDGKQSITQVPLIERHREQSLFHRIKRGFFDLFQISSTSTTTTTVAPTVENPDDDFEEAVHSGNGPANFRTTNERVVDNNERGDGISHDGGRSAPMRYRNTDDEDLAGSGEIEGSAGETDTDHTVPDIVSRKIEGKARYYRMILTIMEPYVNEYADRNSRQHKEFSGNITQAIEEMFKRRLPDYTHFATVVRISPTSDMFRSRATIDLGSTFTDEDEVREILRQELYYHSLGSLQVDPDDFSLRSFAAEPEEACDPSTELRCKNGACVPLKSRCDGVRQCEDGSDEVDCPTDHVTYHDGGASHGVTSVYDRTEERTASPSVTEVAGRIGEDEQTEQDRPTTAPTVNKCRADDTVRCPDQSRYICSVQLCDGVPDCDDGGDELDCPEPGCRSGEFACDGSRCILDKQRCDFFEDCQDGSDEHNCNYPACTSGQYKCRNGECIDSSGHCNGVQDCRDGSDELSCPHCRSDEFECANRVCVSSSARCDGRPDCPDYSDEYNCNVTTCSGDQFRCLDGTCLSIEKRCNGFHDCRNGEDENQCECPDGQLPCDNGACINKNFFCDNNIDCHDGSDERDCPDVGPDGGPTYPEKCWDDQFMCSDGTCIPEALVCNGRADCPRDDDEIRCPTGCARDQFQCRNGDCVRADQKCNGFIDCDDGSDEDCEIPTTPPAGPDRCPAGQFMCALDKACVPYSALCNGIPECRDGTDEDNCGHETDASGLNLKTYPSEQVIKQSREVVFQCRDEGPHRAKVHWIRGNDLPLPAGSRDINGRLEIPNIQLEHAGTYICEAVGYPSSTPGRQLSVHLTVEKFEQPATRPPQVCKYEEATCSNGDCIPKSNVCDGKFDCTDGSDEMRCSPHGCEPNEFRCGNKQCVSKLWRCDGDKDCADGSDEEGCAPAPPGAPCRYNEFACSANNQCIPKSYHCDQERDCLDGSDEIGCSPVYIVEQPPPMVVLDPGDQLTLNCRAIGVPIPEINWRLNWGHIPSKCTTTSVNGTGTLTCPDIQVQDQGAYSCEALNVAGFVFAVPDAILIVKEPQDVCAKGTFNSEARTPDECIPCFCFGVATECRSANLFTYQIPPPFDRHRLLSVETTPEIRLLGDVTDRIDEVQPIGRDGVQLVESYSNDLNDYNLPYFAMPESYHRDQLKSYGGYLKYTIRHRGEGSPNSAPAVILVGNNRTLVHRGGQIPADRETEVAVRFFYGEWYKVEGRHEAVASRQDIMMALANVDNILVKAKYDDSPQLDVRITNIVMDTADVRNTGLGSASYVEECQCPSGYSGLSCQQCAAGYQRKESGPWLGHCYREATGCPPGYYGDPPRVPCQLCPCPLTNPSNQFTRTCRLGSDGQPVCDCPPEYVGPRCEYCAEGYQGNPVIPGDMCVPIQQCDPNGSLSPVADPHTGKCRCKQYATGLTCNQCKANTFNLASANQFGCIACFCMGITNRCVSSNWYRNEIRMSFTNSVRNFSLIESKAVGAPPITEGIRLDTVTREIVYNDFPNRGNGDVYYWQLPSIFLGDQITSYGGNLKYSVRYIPSPGGQSSRNNAADVELISANDINLLYYSRESPEPNSQQSFVVPLLEQYWQRTDGTQADREHLLMALADVQAIRIKATYTTHTDEAALSSVSLDTAERVNTGRSRAVEVEECTCPRGYRGLSCEDCDVGFTRAMEGLYLGICEPCNCNGHSSQCNPETGVCENCAHHTTGENCNVCEPGYEGDATRGTPDDCFYRHSQPAPCRCNEAGSRSPECRDGQCECKRNVEGPECSRCRPSTFGLSEENMDGCNECYCSGVTDQCHESSLYIQQIPIGIYDSHHGFTLTDSTRRDVIDDGFELNVAMNEIGYRYPSNRSRRLFWSLPSVFTGNKVKSYGGRLTITQHITAHQGAQSYKDQDVLLIGNGITLFWTNPVEIQPNVPLTYSVPLRESEWRRLTTEGPRSASRTDLMTVLSNLEAILVRASHSERMTATYISDISLDTAVENVVGSRRATQIEACRCPPGYSGTSCETCSRGYYRDTSDRSVSFLGACNPCPCNKNEESCEVGRSGLVRCNCLPGYTGQYCQEVDGYITTTTQPTPTLSPPRIIVIIPEPEFQIVQVGSTVTYHCTGRSLDNESVQVKWEKEGDQLPYGRSVVDTNGLLVIREVRVSDSGVYVCEVSDGISIGNKKVTLNVGAASPAPPRAMIMPTYIQVKEGEPVEFRCEATGNPQPQMEWVRVRGSMSPEATYSNGVWKLPAASKTDADEYKCIARNSLGTHEAVTILYVIDNPHKPGSQFNAPVINPREWSGASGDIVRLVCTSTEAANITWSRAGEPSLPYSANQRNGVLTISNPTIGDSGLYVCLATSYRGQEASSTARINIVKRVDRPSVKVKPDRQTVSQGSTAEVRCVTSDEPGLQIKWSKYTENMGPNVQQVGDTLRIINAQVSDRGVYVCRVTGPTGSYEASAIIEVERREAPVLELYPMDVQTVNLGGSADLQCRATAGYPIPELHWSRQDGRPFPRNIEQLPAGILRLANVTEYDAGTYVCIAANVVGTVSAVARIEVQSMPVITISPKHGILHVKLGDRVRLMCSATGHPTPNVAWSKHVNGMAIYNAYDRAAGTPLSAVYEIFSVSHNDEGSYSCQATNPAGIAEERVQIRIEEDNDVDYPPCRGDMPCQTERPHYPPHVDPGQGGVLIAEDSLRIPNGGKVELRCQVSDPNGNNIYLDWKRGDHRQLPEGSTVHNGVLTIPTVDESAAGEYICLGLDLNGAVLFRARSHLEIISPPKIVLNPTIQTVGPGENPSIVCTATGDEPLHIEWEAIGRPLPYSVTHDRGVLQFHGITYSDAGKYVCKAKNDAGTANAVAEVLVNEHSYDESSVRAAQRDVVTYAGNSVRLRCEVRERATIHWSREGQPLPANARVGEDYLELSQVRPEDGGRYICQIENSRGKSSDYINLSVSPTVVPAISVEVSQDPVNIGDTIDIRCVSSGTHSPRYHWSRLTHGALPPNAQVYGSVLRLSNVVVSDSGTYRCTADGPDGTFEEDFNLVVHGGHNDAPAIETKFAQYGSSLEMNCRINLDPPIDFQWNKLGGLLPRDAQIFENKLKLVNVKAEDAGTYICTANNSRMNIEVPTVLVVTGVIPNFNQAPNSYVALPPLPDSYLKFNIEVSFKPDNYEGIVFYNEESGRKDADFIALSLVGGYPQFRFDLGSGPATVRSDTPISLGHWHTIKIQRNRKEVTMLVNGEGPYKGVAVGRRQGLDLREPLYVGGVPSYGSVEAKAGANAGFVGCISRLVLGEKQIDLMGDQTDSVGITNCETCAENPCNNGGVCQEAATKHGYTCLCRAGYSGKHCDFVGQSCYPGACGEGKCVDKETGFDCYCPYGKTGARCEQTMNVYEPAFQNDKAYLAHETPKALRRERKSSTTTHSQSRSRVAQLRKPRSRPHHHNNPHHTQH